MDEINIRVSKLPVGRLFIVRDDKYMALWRRVKKGCALIYDIHDNFLYDPAEMTYYFDDDWPYGYKYVHLTPTQSRALDMLILLKPDKLYLDKLVNTDED